MSGMYGTGPKAKATRLHSQVVRQPGRCLRCGSDQNLQAAHIIGRRYNATRTDERNAWCLCATCHFRLGEHPDEHMAFVADTIGLDAYFELKQRAEAGVKANAAFWEGEIARLSALAVAA
jgi:5-methylcytosine-specific restriction endonuclease McrA